MPDHDGGSNTTVFNFACCSWSRAGKPAVWSKIRATGPPAPKAEIHRPMMWGSRSSPLAAAVAVRPWASSQMAYYLSRGVGTRIILRRRSLALTHHCSRNRSIFLTPIITPTILHKAYPVPPQFTKCLCAFHSVVGLDFTPILSIAPGPTRKDLEQIRKAGQSGWHQDESASCYNLS